MGGFQSLVCTLRISRLALRVGRGKASSLSKRPGRRRAGSRLSGRLVAPTTITFGLGEGRKERTEKRESGGLSRSQSPKSPPHDERPTIVPTVYARHSGVVWSGRTPDDVGLTWCCCKKLNEAYPDSQPQEEFPEPPPVN